MISIVLFSATTLVMIGAAVLYPDYRFLYLLCVVIGLSGTVKAYRRWALAKAQGQEGGNHGSLASEGAETRQAEELSSHR